MRLFFAVIPAPEGAAAGVCPPRFRLPFNNPLESRAIKMAFTFDTVRWLLLALKSLTPAGIVVVFTEVIFDANSHSFCNAAGRPVPSNEPRLAILSSRTKFNKEDPDKFVPSNEESIPLLLIYVINAVRFGWVILTCVVDVENVIDVSEDAAANFMEIVFVPVVV